MHHLSSAGGEGCGCGPPADVVVSRLPHGRGYQKRGDKKNPRLRREGTGDSLETSLASSLPRFLSPSGSRDRSAVKVSNLPWSNGDSYPAARRAPKDARNGRL